MEPEEALHFHILRRKKDGVEDWIDAVVEKIGAVPTLNDVLLPAMKEVGDKFGAGELILPFVLQSAEVMKRAVARLENYLDRIEGYTKGTVVLATVFGDVHDIGKSLVNTILTNNGYTVVDLGKQVPIGTIIDAAKEHDATAIGLCALLVSTSKQMPLCVQELHDAGPRVPGADRRRRDQPRLRPARVLYPNGTRRRRRSTSPASSTARTPSRAWPMMDQLVDADARAGARRRRPATRRRRCARRAPSPSGPTPTDDSVRSAARTDVPVPEPPFWGVREIDGRPRRGLPPPRHARAVQAPLGRARREGRGVAEARRRGLPPAPGAHVARAGLPAPARAARLLPLLQRGQRGRRARPRGPREASSSASSSRASPSTTASAWPTSTGRRTRGELDVVALQAVTAGDEVTELMAKLEADGEFAEQLFVHGLGVQTAEGMAEWLHAEVAPRPRHRPPTRAAATRGATRPCPEQSEHEKVFRLLDAPSIGLRLTGGYAVEPEQSTVAIVAHHPQAVYFGMKSGFLPKNDRQARDDLIAGTDRDPASLAAALPDADPPKPATAMRRGELHQALAQRIGERPARPGGLEPEPGAGSFRHALACTPSTPWARSLLRRPRRPGPPSHRSGPRG